MRRLDAQPKVATEQAIPENFKAFMAEVVELIDRGDETTAIESDDLLQTKAIYGGLLDASARQFGFTLFVHGYRRGKWEMLLSEQDIRDIVLGKKTSISLWMCKDLECGSGFSDPTGNCFDCDWKGEEK
jgi:hypothetical protein